MEFRCNNGDCKEVFTYQEREKHWETCYFKIKCPFNFCQETDLVTLARAKKHWQQECVGIEATCQICEEKTRRNGKHDCDKYLRKIVQKLKAENKKLKKIEHDHKQKFILCPKGHPVMGYSVNNRRPILDPPNFCSGCDADDLLLKNKYSCSHDCVWVLCETCYMCPKKHILTIAYNRPGD